ncbi:MAG TPA: respiratory nitrate reductase subunit gamma [Terriglobales bacterium]|nr:respiratory nitrate reductase subunit gamma [Terriglobales bacterium]
MTTTALLDMFSFAVLPYVAIFTFLLVTIERYRKAPFTYSSLSSQFLENGQHFWGLVSFHYGILALFVGHLIGFLLPRQVLWWNNRPARLYVLEISALVFGLMTLIGLCSAIHRRVFTSKARIVTSVADWVVLGLLVFQAALGIYISVFHPWGSSWFAASASPYIFSIFKFNPDTTYLTTLPWTVKQHITNAWLIIALFPFTRLVHVIVAPFPYLWRKPELVRWYGIRRIAPLWKRNLQTGAVAKAASVTKG